MDDPWLSRRGTPSPTPPEQRWGFSLSGKSSTQRAQYAKAAASEAAGCGLAIDRPISGKWSNRTVNAFGLHWRLAIRASTRHASHRFRKAPRYSPCLAPNSRLAQASACTVGGKRPQGALVLPPRSAAWASARPPQSAARPLCPRRACCGAPHRLRDAAP